VRVFTLSLHSPSVVPGNTSYVRDEGELHSLLTTCRNYFRFFLDEVGGQPMTAADLRRHVAPSMRIRTA
jgi:hypothetical protein